MVNTGQSHSVPVIDGLFRQESGEVRLVGGKCSSCGTHFFPKLAHCNNPKCHGNKPDEALLSNKGILYSYTIQYTPPPPPFKFEEPYVPFAVGLVELPEGIRVLGIITGCALDKVKIGMALQMVTEKLYVDEKGNDVVTWKFRPAV